MHPGLARPKNPHSTDTKADRPKLIRGSRALGAPLSHPQDIGQCGRTLPVYGVLPH